MLVIHKFLCLVGWHKWQYQYEMPGFCIKVEFCQWCHCKRKKSKKRVIHGHRKWVWKPKNNSDREKVLVCERCGWGSDFKERQKERQKEKKKKRKMLQDRLDKVRMGRVEKILTGISYHTWLDSVSEDDIIFYLSKKNIFECHIVLINAICRYPFKHETNMTSVCQKFHDLLLCSEDYHRIDVLSSIAGFLEAAGFIPAISQLTWRRNYLLKTGFKKDDSIIIVLDHAIKNLLHTQFTGTELLDKHPPGDFPKNNLHAFISALIEYTGNLKSILGKLVVERALSLGIFGQSNQYTTIKKLIFPGKESGSIYFSEAPFKKCKKLPIEGHDLDLSPDGGRIAFTYYLRGDELNTIKSHGGRTIKIFDLETNTIRHFDSLVGRTSYNAKWSPLGDLIVFSLLDWPPAEPLLGWQIAILDPQTKAWTTLVSPEGKAYSGDQPTWAPDGESILFHDQYNIYEVDISGVLKRRISKKDQLGTNYVNTIQINKNRTKLLFTGDPGKIFSVSQNEPASHNAIFVYNFVTANISQVSPGNISAYNPHWGPNEEKIIFGGKPLSKKHMAGKKTNWETIPGLSWLQSTLRKRAEKRKVSRITINLCPGSDSHGFMRHWLHLPGSSRFKSGRLNTFEGSGIFLISEDGSDMAFLIAGEPWCFSFSIE